MCAIVPNFVKIGQTVPEIWPIFDFSRWRPSAILDLFYACWDHPRRVPCGLCDCAKFGCNRLSNFDSMQILIFCTLSLKMPIHAPKSKIGVLRVFYAQNGELYERDPQKAHPWAETRRMTYRSSKSVHRCALASRRIKQKTKKLKNGIPKKPQHVFFTCSPRPPTLPHGFACVDIPATWLYIPSFVEIRSGVSEPQGSKFGLSHYFGYSLLQQLVLPYKPWLKVRASSGTAVYPHMPILRPHSARISCLTFTSAHVYGTINRTPHWLQSA